VKPGLRPHPVVPGVAARSTTMTTFSAFVLESLRGRKSPRITTLYKVESEVELRKHH
jgi:hypothetical protein